MSSTSRLRDFSKNYSIQIGASRACPPYPHIRDTPAKCECLFRQAQCRPLMPDGIVEKSGARRPIRAVKPLKMTPLRPYPHYPPAGDAQIAKLFTPRCYCYCCRRDNYAAAQLNRAAISSFGIDRALINSAFADITLASRAALY